MLVEKSDSGETQKKLVINVMSCRWKIVSGEIDVDGWLCMFGVPREM